jgi:hypothetical protein
MCGRALQIAEILPGELGQLSLGKTVGIGDRGHRPIERDARHAVFIPVRVEKENLEDRRRCLEIDTEDERCESGHGRSPCGIRATRGAYPAASALSPRTSTSSSFAVVNTCGVTRAPFTAGVSIATV